MFSNFFKDNRIKICNLEAAVFYTKNNSASPCSLSLFSHLFLLVLKNFRAKDNRFYGTQKRIEPGTVRLYLGRLVKYP